MTFHGLQELNLKWETQQIIQKKKEFKMKSNKKEASSP